MKKKSNGGLVGGGGGGGEGEVRERKKTLEMTGCF